MRLGCPSQEYGENVLNLKTCRFYFLLKIIYLTKFYNGIRVTRNKSDVIQKNIYIPVKRIKWIHLFSLNASFEVKKKKKI